MGLATLGTLCQISGFGVVQVILFNVMHSIRT